jgi:hypothetical protein
VNDVGLHVVVYPNALYRPTNPISSATTLTVN